MRVITDARYRANGVPGSGFVDATARRTSGPWRSAIRRRRPAAPRRLTSGEFGAANHQWSPDGREIYFTADRRRESYYYPGDSDLYAVAVEGGEPRRVVEHRRHHRRRLRSRATASASRSSARANAQPERSYDQPDLWVVDRTGGTPRNLTTAYDFDIGGAIGGDQRAPRGQLPAAPVWSADGNRVFVRVGEQGNAVLAAVDAATGKVDRTIAAQDLMSYTADAAAARFAMVISTPTVLGDLVRHRTAPSGADAAEADDVQRRAVRRAEDERAGGDLVSRASTAGGFRAGSSSRRTSTRRRSTRSILQIHGGPHSAYGNTFTHEFQWMAAKGYVVLYTNPRGSSNYGQDFGNIIQFNYPGDDYKDLMAGVDEVLKKGYIDDKRLGVTGGSGGGLLTNWVVTQTTRFKAAVSQRDISDWTNFWYTADFTLFTPTWFRKAPFEDPAEFAARSPITYVTKIQTPLMFILGDEDLRTPPSAGGEDLFRALKYLKRPTVMVRFPGESHELSRSGRPWHRVERLQHIVGWFDKYLTARTPEPTTPNSHR